MNALKDLGKEFAASPLHSADGLFASQIGLFKDYLVDADELIHEAAEDALTLFLEKVDSELLKT